MNNFTITIRAWDTERTPEEVVEHVSKQVAEGYTSGHDLGLYWEVKDDPQAPKEEAPAAEAGPPSSPALEALHRLASGFDAPLHKYGGPFEEDLREARAVLRKAKRAGWKPAEKKRGRRG